VGEWESRSNFQGSPAVGSSTTQVSTTVHAFRMAGSKVTLHGRFWVTPEADPPLCRILSNELPCAQAAKVELKIPDCGSGV
jgi:hypothetical protein